MSTDKMRRQFEAYLRSIWTDGYACTKYADESRYVNEGAQNYWICWQAALATVEPVDQQLLDFYDVKTANELITIQERSIKRLQEQLAEIDRNAFRQSLPRG